MEYQKILGKTTDSTKLPKFITRKWIELFDQSNNVYNPHKDIRFKKPQLRSDLCDFNDVYIVVTGKTTATNPDNAAYDRKLAFKNNMPFYSAILKINKNLIEDAQDLGIVTPMYNLHYYSKNYRKTTRTFWNYYRDEPNSGYVGNNARTRIFYPIKESENFDYKTKLVGKLSASEEELEDITIAVPLKDLSRFIFNLNILLINSEIELILKWSQNCVLTEKATRTANAAVLAQGGNPAQDAAAEINAPSDLKFNVTDCKLHVPVVTLQAEYENKLYEELKTGITIDFKWNEYRSQMINQPATDNFNYLIESTFNNLHRLFVLAFENDTDRSSFDKYYQL